MKIILELTQDYEREGARWCRIGLRRAKQTPDVYPEMYAGGLEALAYAERHLNEYHVIFWNAWIAQLEEAVGDRIFKKVDNLSS